MAKNQPLYKRDRRRSFNGSLSLDSSYAEIMSMPVELLQSMYAAYQNDPQPLQKIVSNVDKNRYNERVYVSRVGRYIKPDIYTNLASTLILKVGKPEVIDYMRAEMPHCLTIYGKSIEELDFLIKQVREPRMYEAFVKYAMHVYGYDDPSDYKSFFKRILGDDLNVWTKICTEGVITDVNQYRRFIPANEELGTPAFYLYHNLY